MDEIGIKHQQIAGQDTEEQGSDEEPAVEGSHRYGGHDVKCLLTHLIVQLIGSDQLESGQRVSKRRQN